MWPVFALIGALCETTKDVLGKTASRRTNEYATAFSLQFFGALTLFPILLFFGIPKIAPAFWLVVIGFCLTIPTANVLYMRAIKLSPLSVSVPMLAFNPIITALLAIFFDHRFPTPMGWIGVALVCTGLYCLRLERATLHKGLLYPLVRIREEPGAIAMLGVTAIWAVGAHLSAAAVRFSSPLFAAWVGAVVGSVILFVVAKRHTHITIQMFREHIHYLAPLGILDGFSNLFMNTALSMGLTAYVISIKRTNILWSSLMGKFLYKEPVGKIKLFGLLLMLFGIVEILIK